MSKVDKKVSFADVLAETENKHRVSDLQNLAHALTDLKKYLKEGNKLVKEIETLAAEIDNEDVTIEEGRVKKVYDSVRNYTVGRY